MFKKILKYTALAAVLIASGILLWAWCLYASADLKMPEHAFDDDGSLYFSDSLRTYDGNWLRLGKDGIWEMKVSGNSFERGYAIGQMSSDLLYYQENVFVEQIRRLIPSDSYLKFLRFFIIMFNRNLGENVDEEYRNEIYGISASCTHEFDAIGTPYERQMQYHSAHDIGHAMQDFMMVGCTSFAAWDGMTADGGLLVGRNFDFYMGDDFSRNKLVSFFCPDDGYRFASVSWPGMIGVLSGMNEKGLTVTINAARSDIPTSSATPISILAREILQYASDIGQAYRIASRHRTFVSESILIGSAADHMAAVIEISPDKMSLFAPEGDKVICTNHFQSNEFMSDRRNSENIRTSDSPYRYKRTEELAAGLAPLDRTDAAAILRDRYGLGGCELGLTNEMAVNQLIAHHSVIFMPDTLMMWVSTAPWQCGKYVAYDLRRIFSDSTVPSGEICIPQDSIAHDPFLDGKGYSDALEYRRIHKVLRACADAGTPGPDGIVDSLVAVNPHFYGTYDIAGDYYFCTGEHEKAVACWEKALALPVPKTGIRDSIEKKIKKCKI